MLRSATILTTLVLATSSAMAAEDATVWHTDLDKAKSIARETKRPLFLVFR